MRTLWMTLALGALLPTSAFATDWEARLADAMVRAAQDPELSALRVEQPRATRAGHLRFTSPRFNQLDATPIALDRLAHGGEPEAVRAALADLVGRFSDGWGDALVELLAEEPASSVRAVLVHGLRTVDQGAAVDGFAVALLDSSPDVRAEAARIAARRGDGAAVDAGLVDRLADEDAGVRAAAANSLGILGVDASAALVPLLDDGSPEVRLQAMRALSRSTPGALSPARLQTLTADPDARVARAAGKLLPR
jgi:HEAT repeat protein